MHVLARSGQVVNTTLVGSSIGFGCLSVILIGALLYTVQRSRRHGSGHVVFVETNGKY